jgi:hypothetical protein
MPTKEIEMVLVTCCECGVIFGLESGYRSVLQKNGKTFHCPNGHGQWYGKSESDRLKEALDAERRTSQYWRGHWETERNAKNGMKGQLQKTKNELSRTKQRISNGVCPCCHRQFVNLHRHMNNQHPDYSEPDTKNMEKS